MPRRKSIKLELISPCRTLTDAHREHWDNRFPSFIFGVRQYSSPYLALPTLAALTPPNVEVSIIDENVESINFDKKVDMVGITVPTFLAPRAYEIADEFRKRGVTVVLGGIHASMLPEEAIQHADAVVIGEAEEVWTNLIKDYRENKLQTFYRSLDRPKLNNQPPPRWNLLKNKFYKLHTIQTTRGCPYDCEFCSVRDFLGRKYRCKSLPKVISEIKMLMNIEKKIFFFVDDNFIGNKKRVKTLLRSIIPLNIIYCIQAPLNVARDTELLQLLAESGCSRIFIGFESISKATIKQMNKSYSNHVEEYEKDVEKVQSYGIGILGSFIFGHDSDDESIFENTVDFINRVNIESVVFHILTPFPGTRLFARLNKEGRILHKDWSKYDATYVCFKPKQMSPETLQNGLIWANQQVYSYESIFKRLRELWSSWNKTNVRLWDRASPIIINLSGNDKAYTHPTAVDPKNFNNVEGTR